MRRDDDFDEDEDEDEDEGEETGIEVRTWVFPLFWTLYLARPQVAIDREVHTVGWGTFFFPTRPGDYSFHFTGTIKGQAVDTTFTSGPSTFSSVIDPGTVEFPAKDPTTGELAQRLDRELPRLALATQAQAARHQADSASLFGIIGIAVGVVGLVVGATALALARRRP